MSDTKRDDGGSAFPEVYSDTDWPDHNSDRPPVTETYSRGGMSLRDYFAGQAMTGYLAALKTAPKDSEVTAFLEQAADMCYATADAMLKERAK